MIASFLVILVHYKKNSHKQIMNELSLIHVVLLQSQESNTSAVLVVSSATQEAKQHQL